MQNIPLFLLSICLFLTSLVSNAQIETIKNTTISESIAHDVRKGRIGQTFTVDRESELISISLKFTNERANGGLLAYDIYELNGTSLNYIASSDISGYYVDTVNQRTFPHGVFLSTGRTYAFLCRNNGWNLFHLASSRDEYANGKAFVSKVSSNNPFDVSYEEIENKDLYFEIKTIDPVTRRVDIPWTPIIENKDINTNLRQYEANRQFVGQTFNTGDLDIKLSAISVDITNLHPSGGYIFFDLYEKTPSGFKYLASTESKGYYINKINRRHFKEFVQLNKNTTYAFVCRSGYTNVFKLGASNANPYRGGNAILCNQVTDSPKSIVFNSAENLNVDLVFQLFSAESRLRIINGSNQTIKVNYVVPGSNEKINYLEILPSEQRDVNTVKGDQWEVIGLTDNNSFTVTSKERIQAFRFDPPSPQGIPNFYTKTVYANGYPIVGSTQISSYALEEAKYLVNMMLSRRRDVRQAMINSGARMCVLAYNEFTTDQPEFERLGIGPNIEGKTAKEYWDSRARGLGGSETDPFCSSAEENLLAYPGDPYSTENILIHEFAHNIHLRGLINVDPTFDERLLETYISAMKAGLWEGKYAANNHHEYFAEGVQSWFDNNRENDDQHNHVNTRAELLEYDPGLAAICKEVFGSTQLKYTNPTTRLTGHLQGYNPENAPTFRWRN